MHMHIPNLDKASEQYQMLEYISWSLMQHKKLCTEDIEEDLKKTGFWSMIVNRWEKLDNYCYKPPYNKSRVSRDLRSLHYISKQLSENNFITIYEENIKILKSTGILQMLMSHWNCIEGKEYIIAVPKF